MIAAYREMFDLALTRWKGLAAIAVLYTVIEVAQSLVDGMFGDAISPALAFAISLPSLVLELWVTLALIIAVAEWREGREISLLGSLRAAWGRIPRGFGVALHYYALLVIGVMLFVLPSLYFMGVYAFVLPIVALERLSHSDTFIQSRELARGRVFALIVVNAVPTALSIAPELYAKTKGTDWVAAVGLGFGSLIEIALSVFITVLYLRLRPTAPTAPAVAAPVALGGGSV